MSTKIEQKNLLDFYVSFSIEKKGVDRLTSLSLYTKFFITFKTMYSKDIKALLKKAASQRQLFLIKVNI